MSLEGGRGREVGMGGEGREGRGGEGRGGEGREGGRAGREGGVTYTNSNRYVIQWHHNI